MAPIETSENKFNTFLIPVTLFSNKCSTRMAIADNPVKPKITYCKFPDPNGSNKTIEVLITLMILTILNLIWIYSSRRLRRELITA